MTKHNLGVATRALVASLVFFASAPLWAAGKPKPAQNAADFHGKRVIALAPIRNVRIQMPDESYHDFGADFQAVITRMLNDSGRYRVADPVTPRSPGDGASLADVPPSYEW